MSFANVLQGLVDHFRKEILVLRHINNEKKWKDVKNSIIFVDLTADIGSSHQSRDLLSAQTRHFPFVNRSIDLADAAQRGNTQLISTEKPRQPLNAIEDDLLNQPVPKGFRKSLKSQLSLHGVDSTPKVFTTYHNPTQIRHTTHPTYQHAQLHDVNGRNRLVAAAPGHLTAALGQLVIQKFSREDVAYRRSEVVRVKKVNSI